jgi:hypothetical protein
MFEITYATKNWHDVWILECEESMQVKLIWNDCRNIKYMLHLMWVQEVRWAKGGTEPAQDYKILFENGKKNCHKVTSFLIHKGIIAAKESMLQWYEVK